jgi:hypothetical protein
MRSASPLEGKTTDRRPASPVRREGGPGNRFSLPLFVVHRVGRCLTAPPSHTTGRTDHVPGGFQQRSTRRGGPSS